MSIFNEKKALRKEILSKRKNIKEIEKEKMDKRISDKLYESKFYNEATNIFVYISYDSEIDTKGIINKALKDNKRIYVPRTEFETRTMDAVEIKSFNKLIKSDYGILEPSKNEACIDPNELDLIVVPGVAFDRDGGRMGYGAGFYDRYFKKITEDNIKRITKLVLAYDFQVLDKVPMSEQDVPVDYIITEKEFIE
jgi:5-formyltetrahydrofolate cyclo-ligase